MSRKKAVVRIALFIVAVLALVVTPAAVAGKGKGGGGSGGGATTSTSSLSLILLGSSDGQAHQGQYVTFQVSTTATDRPFVRLDCYQGGVWVYTGSAGFFPDYPWTQDFVLASSAWTSGAASCTATLYMTKDGTRLTTLATLSFPVAA